MGRKTVLHDLHVALGARMVDFGGWDMPVNYGSQIEEHHRVRREAGVFDVSHMCVVDLRGAGVRRFLSRLLANDVGKLWKSGKALYSCMLNDAGGVIDDLIVYYQGEQWWRIVVNAGTRDKDLAWMRRCASEWQVELSITERTDLAIVAVQGPQARTHVASLLEVEDREPALSLGSYEARECGLWFVARTGYTGEDGFEVMLPAEEAPSVWRALNAAGVASCGLGARDTLRLEAGMNLYGNDMDESHHPLESNLAWTVAFEPADREFVGRAALERLRAAGVPHKLVGLVLEERGVLRAHQRVMIPAAGNGEDAGNGEGAVAGEITSGSFSPTLERSIAFARVPRTVPDVVQVDIRGKLLPARVVKLPFVRHGRILINL